MMSPVQFTIRDYSQEDTGAVLALAQHALGGGPTGKREETFWRWKHLQNPFGPSLILLALDSSEQVIGLRCFMRWRFRQGDRVFSAARAVDAATHSAYRGRGVYSRIMVKAMERLKGDGAQVVFGTPNMRTANGWQRFDTRIELVRPMIKVLNYPRFLLGVMASRGRHQSSAQPEADGFLANEVPSVSEVLKQDDALERLIASHGQTRNGHFATDRSVDYLKWRYVGHPYTGYKAAYVEKHGEMEGCLVFRLNRNFGLREVVLDEMFLARPDESCSNALFDQLRRSLRADYVIAYAPEGSFERRVLSANGFRQLPMGGMRFFMRAVSAESPAGGPRSANWLMTLGDLEVF